MARKCLVLECPTTQNRSGSRPKGGCCTRRVLEVERDFRDQKGRPQKEVEALGHGVLLHPKFHCKLNFTVRYWCRAKWFARGNCGYDFETPKATAFASVTNASIRGFAGWHCVSLMLALPACNRTAELSRM